MSAAAEQLLLDLRGRAALEAADFLPGAANRDALAWLARWPDWPGPALVLYGAPGTGKSHLARIFARRTGAVPLDPVRLPAPGDQPRAHAVVVDPVEHLQDEETLLHLYNDLQVRGGHLLLVGRTPVARWPVRLPDLASRLRAAPAVEVGPPDDALLAGLLIKLFGDRQIRVEQPLIDYLLRRMERSHAGAGRLVADLDALSLRLQRPVTLPLARLLFGQAAERSPEEEREPADGPGDRRP